jgi:type IV pilus assembly protein PilW
MNQEINDLYIPTGNTLSQWDIVMVADCKAADLFQITSPTTDVQMNGRLAHSAVVPPAPHAPGNQLPALSQIYGANAEVFTLVTNAYFVGTGANNVPALFRKQITAGAIETSELVDNVESLQVFYGVDTDNTGVANQYQVANAIVGPGWATVASVRVGLLARTPDEHGVDVDTNTYDVAGDPGVADDFDPTDDRRQRRVFTSTINVRNYTLFTRG